MRVVWLIILVFVVAGGGWAYTRMERTPPLISTRTTPSFASGDYEHEFRFTDEGTGLRSARIWLESIGLWDKLKDNVVPALNVRAALSAVESENADAGIVYRTDARMSKRVKVAFEVPKEQGPAIVYPLAPVASSTKAATAALCRHLVSPAAREAFARYGFLVLPGR